MIGYNIKHSNRVDVNHPDFLVHWKFNYFSGHSDDNTTDPEGDQALIVGRGEGSGLCPVTRDILSTHTEASYHMHVT